MALFFHALIVIVLLVAVTLSAALEVKNAVKGVPGGSDIKKIDGYTFVAKGKFGSSLYTINAPTSVYADPPLLMDLRGPGGFEQG
jgi:hypothetical protein